MDHIIGVNNLFFTVLMITEGQIPDFLPEGKIEKEELSQALLLLYLVSLIQF